ncbi:hypothetical protein [Mesorhizobium sp. CAU 1741]|uniref:hypothetical protein n=1 Tax=Mesorhizobium sp. CAU 1741 TaxID=3140366 RepID=UPI00325BF95A
MANNVLKKSDPDQQPDAPAKKQNRGPLIAMLLVGGIIVFFWVAFLLWLVLHLSGIA